MRVAQPPTDPPVRRTMTCPTCEGDGKTYHVTDYLNVRIFDTCSRCDGDGEVDFDPDSDPYAPDTWREAEGIA